MKILIGTNNFNKFGNYKDAFDTYAPEVELLKVSDLKITEDPEESFDTLKENAIKKATVFGEISGLITLADDTGLFVDALNGEPGLHTKRWHTGSDHDRCVKLLERLVGKDKKASYRWAVAAYNPSNKKVWTFESILEGEIAGEFKDAGGFGYDKMFIVPVIKKYYSELSKEDLLDFGGRGRAVKELILNTNFLK
jgi:XTP/dITP diphosphohydrolase